MTASQWQVSGESSEEEEEDEEDILGDNEWAKTNEADFSSAVDDMFGDLLAMKAEFEEETPAHLRDVKMSQMGDKFVGEGAEEEEDAAAAEVAAAEAVAAEAVEAERRKQRSEQRSKLTPMEKKAKASCNMKYKARCIRMSVAGELAEPDEYTKALAFMEAGEFIEAERAFKLAVGTPAEKEPATGSETAPAETEPATELEGAGEQEKTAVQLKEAEAEAEVEVPVADAVAESAELEHVAAAEAEAETDADSTAVAAAEPEAAPAPEPEPADAAGT